MMTHILDKFRSHGRVLASHPEDYSRADTRAFIARLAAEVDSEGITRRFKGSNQDSKLDSDRYAGFVEPSGPCTHYRWWVKRHGEYIDYTKRDFRTIEQILDADARRKAWLASHA